MKYKLKSIAQRNINNFRYAVDITLMAESKEEPRSLLMKMREESGKSGLKFNIQKTKIRASGPIPSWQKMGEKMETVTDCIFLGSKISHEIKRCFPWKKSYDKCRQCIKKQRHHFANKGPSIKAMVFPVVMHRCESWNIGRLSTKELVLSNCGNGEDS